MMKRSSRSAEYVAYFRALESARPDTEARAFYDQYAHMFLHGWKKWGAALSHIRSTRHLMYHLTDRRVPGARAAGIARTIYIDKQLNQILPQMSALVILGAGFDTRPLRLAAAKRLPCFELDTPATQKRKKDILASVFAKLSRPPVLVPIDFNKQSMTEALTGAGFNKELPACFLWEGVSNYLQPEAVDSKLREIANFKAGSMLIFTYVDKKAIQQPKRFYNAAKLQSKLLGMGEPWLFGLAPEEAASYLAERGLTLVSDIGVADVWNSMHRPAYEIRGYEFYRIAIVRVGV
ncbi:MAG: SAM-dependent methyltransferase [Bryocella sp.]